MRATLETAYYLTQADVDAGQATNLSGARIVVVDATTGQPTGQVYESGAAGQPPSPVGGTANAPASLVGSGAIALTLAAHGGRQWHAEPGQTSATLAAADWSTGGELSLINHSGEALPITLGAGWSGGYVNAAGGASVATGELASLKPLERAIVQVKSTFVNVAIIAGAAPEKGWATLTDYRAGDIVRAPSAQGAIGAGDRIIRSAKGKSRATFDATEAGLWAEIAEDPDAMLKASNLSDLASVATARDNLGLGGAATLNVGTATGSVAAGDDSRLSNARAPTSHAASHGSAGADAVTPAAIGAQATLVSGTNIRTVNGSSLVGAGNVSIASDLPGGAATTVTDEGLVTTGSPTIDRATVPGETILRYTGNGTFVPPLGVVATRVLVVAGGGGGGYAANNGRPSGGGGAGGLRTNAALAVVPGQSYAVTVGAAGPGGTTGTGNGTNGGASSIGSLISVVGGGGGGGSDSAGGGIAGSLGGSGGGGKAGSPAGAGGAGTAGEGFAGGSSNTDNSAGGGGGAGGVGGSATTGPQAGGAGGTGITSDITGASVIYGGGGGGGSLAAASGTAGAGGSGGGGAGSATGGGAAGTDGLGGGGGGSSSTSVVGGAGGSGVIIVRFATQTRSYQALGGYANDAAAATGSILLGQFYRDSTSGAVRQRVV